MPPKRAKKAYYSKAILNAPQGDESVYLTSLPSLLLLPLDCLPSLDPLDEPKPLIKLTIDKLMIDANKPP